MLEFFFFCLSIFFFFLPLTCDQWGCESRIAIARLSIWLQESCLWMCRLIGRRATAEWITDCLLTFRGSFSLTHSARGLWRELMPLKPSLEVLSLFLWSRSPSFFCKRASVKAFDIIDVVWIFCSLEGYGDVLSDLDSGEESHPEGALLQTALHVIAVLHFPIAS